MAADSSSLRALGAVAGACLGVLSGCFGRSGIDGDGPFKGLVPEGGVLADASTGLVSGSGGSPGASGAENGGSVVASGGRGDGGSVFGAGGRGDGGSIFGGGGNLGDGGSIFGTGGSIFGSGGNGTGGAIFGSGGSIVGAGGSVTTGGVTSSGGASAGGSIGTGGNGTGGFLGAGGSSAGGSTGAGGFTPVCSAVTCSTGCCDQNGQCQDGRTDLACGVSGQSCTDCTASGEHCAGAGYCYLGQHCGPDICGGCCGPNGGCRAGTTAAACGRFGDSCDQCAAGDTCQNGACGAPGATCPAPYGACNPGSSTSVPATSTSCTATELSAVQKACKGLAASTSCTTTITTLARDNPGCFGCLSQFLSPTGAVKCLAPFLTAECNAALTCATDCSTTSCNQCAAAEKQGCQDAAFQPSGACYPFISGYFCAQAAFGSGAAFCDIQTLGDIGLFLQGAGAYYCSP